MLDHALRYVARGLPVFPLATGDKVPLFPSAHPDREDPQRGVCRGECGRMGHGFHDATTDPARVREWWARKPLANVGARTGIRFDVLDVDPRHGGAATLAALVERNGPLPAAPEAATGGGGRHLLFAPDPRVRCSAGQLGDGLDVRGGGGFVVAPPSLHPSGRRYAWTVRSIPPPPWPAWVLVLILPAPSILRPVAAHVLRADGRCSPYGAAVLRSACERVEAAREGRRHEVLRHGARLVAGYVAGGEVDEALARECLLAASALPEAEALRLIAWAFENGMALPLRAPHGRKR